MSDPVVPNSDPVFDSVAADLRGPGALSVSNVTDGNEATTAHVHYCPLCGSAWAPTWTHCEVCATKVALPGDSESASRQNRKGIRSAIALYFVILITNFASFIVAGAIFPDESLVIVYGSFIAILIDVVTVLAWTARWWSDVKSAILSVGEAKWYGIAAVSGCLTFALADAVVNGLHQVVGLEIEQYSDDFIAAGYGWLTVFSIICIHAPLCEELAFRGVIYGAFQHVLDAKERILVTGLMFMVIHLALPSFPHLFLLGLALGFLRWKSGTIYPCILMHFTHNLLVLVTEYHGW